MIPIVLPKNVFILPAVLLLCLILQLFPAYGSDDTEDIGSASERTYAAYQRAYPRIKKQLAQKNLDLGSPVFIRIFKQSKELEVWMRDNDNTFVLYKTFAICHHSGTLGPKQEEGDRQSPEGFYRVGSSQMNPLSQYHLAFNLGYPNSYDLAYGRTGDALMVHGRCSSIGCFAMTDYYMDEIYTLTDRALASGQQEFQVHIFPFRLTPENLAAQRSSTWLSFWKNLKEGFDYFEKNRRPPIVDVRGKRYVIYAPPRHQIAYMVDQAATGKTPFSPTPR